MSDIEQTAQQEQDLPLGQHLTTDRLLAMGLYLYTELEKSWNKEDTMEGLVAGAEKLKAQPEETWNQDYAIQVVKSFKNLYMINNGIETEDELQRATENEQSFQRICAQTIESMFSFVPRLRFASIVLPPEKVQERIASILESSPGQILSNAESIATAELANAGDILKSAIEKADFSKSFTISSVLKPSVIEVLGLETAQKLAKSILTQNLANPPVYDLASSTKSLIEQDLMLADELLSIGRQLYAKDPEHSIQLMDRLYGSEKLEPAQKQEIKDTLNRIINDSNSSIETVKGVLACHNVYGDIFDKEHLKQAYKVHGADIVVALPYAYNDVLDKHEFARIMVDEVGRLREQMHDGNISAGGDLSSRLVHNPEWLGDALSPADRTVILNEIAEISPDSIITKGKSLYNHLDQETVNSLLDKAVLNANARQMALWVDELVQTGHFDSEDLTKLIFSKAIANGEVREICNTSKFMKNLSPDQALSLATAGLEELLSDERTSEFFIAHFINNLAPHLSPEDGRRLLRSVPQDKQLITNLYFIKERPHFLNKEEMTDILGQLSGEVSERAVNVFLSSFDFFVPYVPKGTSIEQLIDNIFQNYPGNVLLNSAQLFKYISPERQAAYLQELETTNPAGLLYVNNRAPIAGLEQTDIIQRMAKDPRLDYADKFFRKLIKRLPNVDGTTAYEIMLREAMGVFAKINSIKKNPEAQKVFETLKPQINKSIGDEIGLLQGVYLLSEDSEITDIETLADFKRAIISRAFKQLGLDEEPEVEVIYNAIPDFTPLAVYIDAYADKSHGKVLAELLTALNQGRYTDWKYQESDFQKLIDDGLVPHDLTKSQYAQWQASEQTSIKDIGAINTEALAHKVSATLVEAARYIPGLEDILKNETKPIVLRQEAQESIKEIGQRTGELHRIRRDAASMNEQQRTELENELEQLAERRASLEYTITLTQLLSISGEEIAAGRFMNEKGKLINKTIQSAFKEIADRSQEDVLDMLTPIETEVNAVYETTEKLGDVFISDVHDLDTTIEIGAYPVGSCQHYEQGSHNAGLFGYTDPNVKIMVASNSSGGLVARSIMRLVSEPGGQPALLLERVYTSYPSIEIESGIMANAAKKAEEMGIKLYVSKVAPEAERSSESIQLFQASMRAPMLYTDMGGGVLAKEAGTVNYEAYQYQPAVNIV